MKGVADLVLALEQGVPLRDALADALGDPSVELRYWVDRRGWVDAEGRAASEPTADGERAVRVVERAGRRVAALVHDRSLTEEPQLVDAVASAAGLSLQNERLQAELRAQYGFLTTIVETAPSLLVNVGLDGRILNLNPATVTASGHADEEEVRGRFFWDVFLDEDEREAARDRFRLAAIDVEPAEYESTFTNARGERVVIVWRSAPVRDADGRVVSLIAGGIDVTERTRHEEELRRQRDFLSTIARSTPSLMTVVDCDAVVSGEGVNRAFHERIGVSDEEAVGQPLVDLIGAPDDAATFAAALTPEGEGAEHETTWRARDGSEMRVAWSTQALDLGYDQPRYLVHGIDVTDRRRREEELQAAHERLHAAIASAPVAIVEIDVDRRIRLWNPAAERIFGWSGDEVLDRVVSELVPDDRLAELEELVRQVRAGEGYTGVETVRRHKDGTLVDVEVSAAPIRDATGAVVRHMVVFTDISDRKRQAGEIRASRARIVRAGDEARRKLERNLHDGAQQRLVALSVSLRLAEAKLETSPEATAAILAGAREELAHALEELRELARGIHPAVLSDRGLAAAVDALVSRSPVPVEADVPDERLPPAVEAALYYVVSESLANVAKYAGASNVHVHVWRDDGSAAVEVTDDGVGGADPGRGSGLRGLLDRVEALNGSFTVVSPSGGGTRVHAEVPL